MAQSKPLCLFPFYSARTVQEQQSCFQSTLDGQLEEGEETVTEFDEKVWI